MLGQCNLAALAEPSAVVMVVMSGLSLSISVSPSVKSGSKREKLRKIGLSMLRFPFMGSVFYQCAFRISNNNPFSEVVYG